MQKPPGSISLITSVILQFIPSAVLSIGLKVILGAVTATQGWLLRKVIVNQQISLLAMFATWVIGSTMIDSYVNKLRKDANYYNKKNARKAELKTLFEDWCKEELKTHFNAWIEKHEKTLNTQISDLKDILYSKLEEDLSSKFDKKLSAVEDGLLKAITEEETEEDAEENLDNAPATYLPSDPLASNSANESDSDKIIKQFTDPEISSDLTRKDIKAAC